jgi:hypothetical protein
VGLQGAEALEIVIECMEPRMDALVAEHPARATADVRVFTDDCVESLSSAPTGSARPTTSTSRSTPMRAAPPSMSACKSPSWDGDWAGAGAACRLTAGGCAITVPWATLEAVARRRELIWSLQHQPPAPRRWFELQLSSWSHAWQRTFTPCRRAGGASLPRRATSAAVLDSPRAPAVGRRAVGDLLARAEIDPQIVQARLHAALAPLQAEPRAGSCGLAGRRRPSGRRRGAVRAARDRRGGASRASKTSWRRALGEAIPRTWRSRAQIRRLAGGRVPVASWSGDGRSPTAASCPCPEPPERLERRHPHARLPRREFAPASFVVYSGRRGDDGAAGAAATSAAPGLGLRARHFDLHAVKRWYQAGEGGTRFPFREEGVRALVPELAAQRRRARTGRSRATRENYLKLRREAGDEYALDLLASPGRRPAATPTAARTSAPMSRSTTRKELQPVTIPADTAQQFWLTAACAEATPPRASTGEQIAVLRRR